MKLSKIASDYEKLLSGDLDTEQTRDLLEQVGGAFEDKAKNVLAVINNLNTIAIDEEIKRLQSMKKAIVNNKDRLKEYLRYNMEKSGISKIEHPLFKVTLGKPSSKVEVFDIDLLPDEFVNVKTEIKPDLNKIKAALKDGPIDGACMVEGASRLLIK